MHKRLKCKGVKISDGKEVRHDILMWKGVTLLDELRVRHAILMWKGGRHQMDGRLDMIYWCGREERNKN